MTDDQPLDRETWATLLDGLDPATWGELRRAVVDADMLDVDDPGEAVDDALRAGLLVERDDGGAFPTIALADDEPIDDQGVADDGGDRGGYRALYLKARQRAGADRAWVPHEDVVAVFSAAGYGDVVDDLRYQSEWSVWTPDARDTPLYAYTPDLAGDTDRQRERFADLLAEAGVGRERFVDVLDGQKASFDTGDARPPDDPEISGNYGVKGGRGGDDGGGWLVDIDVDDYDDDKAANAAVDRLRDETTAVASAHTTRERPGHLYVAVDGDPREVVRDVLGRDVDNPAPSFGEIRIDNQYVLGPGSAVVCECDRCTAPDAPDHLGRYELANDTAPVVWSPDEFREFLLADPAIERQAEQAAAVDQADDSAGARDAGGGTTADAEGWLALARDADDYVADAIREARAPDDRSEADSALARAVAPWLGYDRSAIADVLDDHGTDKWDSRGASYRDSVLDYALDRRTSVDPYRPLPYWALVEAAVANDVVERDELVARDSDTGEVVADDDTDRDTYTALPSGVYNDALRAIRETYGVDPGREPVDSGRDGGDDPRDAAVVLDPGRAWRAAGLVEPADLDPDADREVPTAETADGLAFATPDGEPAPDVVRAVALDLGLVDAVDDDLGDDYATAYAAAREDYGAPLPVYVSAAEAVADYDTVLGAVRELDFWHLDRDALIADVTAEGDGVDDDAVLTLDPTPVDGWRDSDSGETVLVYPNGTVVDVDGPKNDDGERQPVAIDALRLVALDSGILDDPTDAWGDGDFCEAYRLAREVYDAPLPRWYAAEARELDADRVPFIPDSDDLLGDDAVAIDDDTLDDVRAAVEDLVAEATAPDDVDRVTIVSSLPATGKTTAVIKQASDQPTTYLAPRLDLQAQAVEKAERWGVSYDVLPVFSDGSVDPEAVEQAVEYVREHDKTALREPWRLVEAAGGDVFADDADDDAEGDGDSDDVDLDRATCPTVTGEHGAGWALAAATARALDYTPREIHRDAVGLFGAALPCTCDDHADADPDADDASCPYSAAYGEINDRDDPADLLIGSYVHAHVEGVRTYRAGSRDDPEDTPRAVVLDEYPGDTFATDYGAEAFGFAAWLASALVDDVEARADVTPALADDDLLVGWLDGTIADDVPRVQAAKTALRDRLAAVEAVETAREVRDRYDDLGGLDLDDPLADLVATWDDAGGAPDAGSLRDAARDLLDTIDPIRPTDDAAPIAAWVRDDVVEPLLDTGDELGPDLDALPFPDDGPLASVVAHALDASAERADGATTALDAAATALAGGSDGCRELAIWSDDGYAHPDAAALLRAVITPREADDSRRIHTSGYNYPNPRKPGDATVLKQVDLGDATVLVDENRQGATLLDPPDRTAADGSTAPLVGLDAFPRPELWALALREPLDTVDVVDVHDTPRERAAFLRDHHGLSVAQMSPLARAYSGDPDSKDTAATSRSSSSSPTNTPARTVRVTATAPHRRRSDTPRWSRRKTSVSRP